MGVWGDVVPGIEVVLVNPFFRLEVISRYILNFSVLVTDVLLGQCKIVVSVLTARPRENLPHINIVYESVLDKGSPRDIV
jgi:hypothetical protein